MTLELLLTRAGNARPVLHPGLAEATLLHLPLLKPLDLPERLWDVSGDPNDLSRQRWGLVVPQGPEGERLLDALAPLLRRREAQQGGAPCRVYPVAPGMDGPGAMRWKRQVFRDEAVLDEERPRYLLIAGDLDQVSLELQQQLSTDAFVGRLAFASLEDYASYAGKVLRWEASPAPTAGPRLLFYTAQDGSDAVDIGRRRLIEPSIQDCRDARHLAVLDPRDLVGERKEPLAGLLAHAAEPGPGVLFSLSHGLGRPDGGWRSQAQQRELQGALQLPDGQLLTAEDVRARPFMPGGVWFCFACFGAGTPARSLYADWMRRLPKLAPQVASVLDMLPHPGEAPFTAALPRAVLASPDGPLAVIGHVDLAWTSSFNDEGRGRASRFSGVLKALLEGRRAGAALRHLLRFFNEENMALTTLEAHAAMPGRNGTVDPVTRAHVWMLRQDLSGFVLLGDPAVRLPRAPG